MCDVVFGLFVVSWFVARHILYAMATWSVYADIPRYVRYGCYTGGRDDLVGPFPVPGGWAHWLEPFQDPRGTVCYNSATNGFFLSFLVFLQGITIWWFCIIVQVVMKVLRGGNAEDVRSDDEAEDDNEENFEYEEAQPLEEEVGVEAIDLRGWERRTGVKRAASASGVSLPGHSDRKELLGRIGCERQVD